MTTARSLCAELEQLDLVELDPEHRYVTRVEPDMIEARARDLAGKFEALRGSDARRLTAMADYAATDDCRSRFLRRWFGEADPPRCGRCDRCLALRSVNRASAGAPTAPEDRSASRAATARRRAA